MHDVRLEVNTVAFGGFQSGEFQLSLEQMAGTFTLKYADVWANGSAPVPIAEGDRCKLTIDNQTYMDGWVVEAPREYDAGSRKLTVSGASVTCDLVDCSAIHNPGRWRNQRIGQIVGDLVYPFNAINVMVVGSEGAPIPKFSLDKGETVGSAISRVCRLRGMQCYTAGSDLVITKVGSVRTTTVLRPGRPILRARYTPTLANRFSDYVFKGQTRARDEQNGVAASQIRGTIYDNGVPRYRPLLLDAHAVDGPDDIGQRAIMERNQRAGQSERVECTVEGWTTEEGWLWEPNMLARMTDEWLGIDQDLVVVSAKMTFNGDTGQGGYVTTLELCDPRAFDVGDAPLVRRPRSRYWAGGDGAYIQGGQGFFAPGSSGGGVLRVDMNPDSTLTPPSQQRRRRAP